MIGRGWIRDEDTASLPGTVHKGRCFMVQVWPHSNPTETGKHMVRIWIEDDGNWHEKTSFSSHWLPELIQLLQRYPSGTSGDAHAE